MAESRTPGVGDRAPGFELRRTFEETVRLDEVLRRGPVLLAFYVFDFGPVLTEELSQLGQRVTDIERTGASVVGIGVTGTFSQMAFARHLGVEFPLLSDWGGTTASAYGVRYDVWKGHAGVAKRSLFVIDRAGIIRYRWVTEDALVMPDLDEPLVVLPGLG